MSLVHVLPMSLGCTSAAKGVAKWQIPTTPFAALQGVPHGIEFCPGLLRVVRALQIAVDFGAQKPGRERVRGIAGNTHGAPVLHGHERRTRIRTIVRACPADDGHSANYRGPLARNRAGRWDSDTWAQRTGLDTAHVMRNFPPTPSIASTP